MCLISSVAPAALAAAPGEITLTVKQVLQNTGSSMPAQETFRYRLVPKPASNPMPAGSGLDCYAFALTGTNECNIGPIAFTRAGIYAYELVQTTACPCPREVYALKIYVENDLSVSVVATKPEGTKAMGILFEHSCGNPVPPPETTVPNSTKPPAGNGPKTGDESRIELYMALFCAAGIALLGSMASLLTCRRRGKERDAHEA
jgi:hypothetical protein